LAFNIGLITAAPPQAPSPCNQKWCLFFSLLDKAIWKVQKNGGIAFFVCATLGTKVRGAYDNIEKKL
jgi:sulfinoalanine decarboxylase